MSVPFRQQTAGQLPHLPLNRQTRSRLKRRDRRRFEALERAARSLVLDPLEQRVLLNADVLALDLTAMYADSRDMDLLVRLHEEVEGAGESATTVQRVQILDKDGGAILAFGDLAEISGIAILGGSGAETVTFDAASFGDSTPISLSFSGGGGADTVVFDTPRNVRWLIDGANEGAANDGFVSLDFDGVEWA